MDNTDLNILRLLQENSRESLGKISDVLGISKATVSRRLTRMEQEGYISGYSIHTNPSRLGLMKGIVSLQVNGTAVNAVIDQLRNFKEIESVTRVFGDHGLICVVFTASVDSLYELIQNGILKIPNVHNVEVDIVIDRLSINPDAEFEMARSRMNNPR
ncbi:MAG: Lrp/AsnC family transcriptional regulator [Methanomassiliicoccus sp.]|nr:Lrp/AsnC family transcriptional regulator [Methanomassiliicoccus sp.]